MHGHMNVFFFSESDK